MAGINVTVSSLRAVASVGTVTPSIGRNVSVTGVNGAGQVNSVTVFLGAGVNLNYDGTATIQYMIDPGYATASYGYGWGTGGWGQSAWGEGSAQPVILPQRDWWFDNFDNNLVMNIRNGPIYYWERTTSQDPTVPLNTSAVLLSSVVGASNVPVKAMQVLVSQNDKHLIAFGCVPYGSTNVVDFDPLLIRWANQDQPENWTPTPTNSAGFLRVSRGSAIIRALPTRQEVMVWTDSHLYALQFLGTTDVFGLQEYADNISIIGPRAVATANNVTYWMGKDKFYAYSGRVETLPCTLRNHVFMNLNYAAVDTIVCGTNEGWNEIWWFYPSETSNFPDKYVIYNHLERIWYYGDMERTAWLDSALRDYPLAANTPYQSNTGYVYNHEKGVDADGAPMVSYIQSSDMDISDGEQLMLSRRIIPDISFKGSEVALPEVTLEIRPRNFPGSAYSSDPADSGPVIETTVDTYTDQLFLRARARQMAFKIMSEGQGVQWQLGSPRVDVRTDGKR